jgi:hypothetical protein
MDAKQLLGMNPPPVSPEVDDYITRRLIAFYDGLVERGQIKPPDAEMTAEESSHYRADRVPGPSPIQ